MAIVVDDRIRFGSRLKEVRVKRGISTRSLAKEIGLKSSGNVYLWESGKQLPGEDTFNKLVYQLGVNPDYLLTGKQDERPVLDTNDKFDHRHTEEGYGDPTASAACTNAWFSGKTADTGDLVDDKNGNLYLVIRKVDNNIGILAAVQTTPITNHLNYCVLKQGDVSYYVNLNQLSTHARFLKDFRHKFKVSPISFKIVEGKLKKMLGLDSIVTNTPVEETKDQITDIFVESIKFYNEKNGTKIARKNTGNITLQEAYDISKASGISLDDFCRDHEKEKAEEQILRYMEEQEEIGKKIEELKSKYQIS